MERTGTVATLGRRERKKLVTRRALEAAALRLFAARGFDATTVEDITAAADVSPRTFFRYFATKADAVWGEFEAHVGRLEGLLAATRDDQPVLASICAAYVEVNDYAAEDLPTLRQRMALILGEPALQAHSQVRYADVDRLVAEHVTRRTGQSPEALLPRLVATSTRAAATTACEVWLADGTTTLATALHAAFDQLALGFPGLRTPPSAPDRRDRRSRRLGQGS